jgi:hypothetical protein
MAEVPASEIAAKSKNGIAKRMPNQRIMLSFFYEAFLGPATYNKKSCC